jgi:hypothetical protein
VIYFQICLVALVAVMTNFDSLLFSLICSVGRRMSPTGWPDWAKKRVCEKIGQNVVAKCSFVTINAYLNRDKK